MTAGSFDPGRYVTVRRTPAQQGLKSAGESCHLGSIALTIGVMMEAFDFSGRRPDAPPRDILERFE
ncbi:hypothetical protein [Pelagibius sp.]|uniref:hypothetical protein n=1 Tax=Pelagibius sp. TaxID=1931238 RepID=UPI00260BA0DA|nr:hypothetical protein [Pelagibius sp.]